MIVGKIKNILERGFVKHILNCLLKRFTLKERFARTVIKPNQRDHLWPIIVIANNEKIRSKRGELATVDKLGFRVLKPLHVMFYRPFDRSMGL